MGAIARAAANNITTSGVFTSSAIANSSVTGITVLAGISDGITLISSQTASNSASISFTSGLTSTYKSYKFVMVNMNPATDNVHFTFNLSTDGGSNYNVTKTSTYFTAYHAEAGTDQALTYNGDDDLAQSTDFQRIAQSIGNGNDESCSGSLILFNPSSTTYVKHFISNVDRYFYGDYTGNEFVAGYGNTTSAINAIQFKFASGNMDGTIYLYGIK
jgi:hypothetical protein